MNASSAPSWHALQAATLAYQRNWWRSDATAQAWLSAHPELVPQLEARSLVQTRHLYQELGTEVWARVRQALHDRLARDQLGSGAPPATPTVYFTIGCIGAGKTRVLRGVVHAHRVVRGAEPTALSRIAVDEVRCAMPEYADGRGSVVVEPEVYDLTYQVTFPAARDAGLDIVYDTIGRVGPSGAVSFGAELRELRARGYEVQVLLARAPLQLCVERARYRTLTEDGRLVSPDAQRDMYEEPIAVLRTLRQSGLVDGWAVIDSSGPADQPPIEDGSSSWLETYPAVLGALTEAAHDHSVQGHTEDGD